MSVAEIQSLLVSRCREEKQESLGMLKQVVCIKVI